MSVVTCVDLPASRSAAPCDALERSAMVWVRGDLNAVSGAQLRAALAAHVGAQLVVFDLSRVDAIDAAGIAGLISSITAVRDRAGLAVVITQPGKIFGLLDRLGIGRLAPVLTSIDDLTGPLTRRSVSSDVGRALHPSGSPRPPRECSSGDAWLTHPAGRSTTQWVTG